MAADGVSDVASSPRPRSTKARAKRGKAPIPACTVLRLSAGAASERFLTRGRCGPGAAASCRAAHFRRQPHGPGSAERKLIFVKPVLSATAPGRGCPGRRSASCGYDGRSQVRRYPGRSISGPDPALGFSLDPFQTDIRACILHCDRRRRT